MLSIRRADWVVGCACVVNYSQALFEKQKKLIETKFSGKESITRRVITQ
jgi:hypothetical protein